LIIQFYIEYDQLIPGNKRVLVLALLPVQQEFAPKKLGKWPFSPQHIPPLESYSEMRSRKIESFAPLIRTRWPMNEAGAITVREPYP
jgi:hypothetical protein